MVSPSSVALLRSVPRPARGVCAAAAGASGPSARPGAVARVATAAWLVVAVLAGCATTSSPAPPGRHARDFHALRVGNRWTYRAVGEAAPRVVTLVAFQDGYFVDDRGGRVAPRLDGLFDGHRFLLQDPLQAGHEWIAKADAQSLEHYRIDATDVVVTVPAGTFSGCVQVTGRQEVFDDKTRQAATLLVTSTWAPAVGVVRVEFRVQRPGARPETTSLTELVAFDTSLPVSSASTPASTPPSIPASIPASTPASP